ncbi:MAG TPA: response regulator, partial [Candidatus Acidoferrum sp.]|nr:response regulator [Candidatus Acidoferrum sp.]
MSRRILLVDDELALLLTLKAVLELSGFEVVTAASAAEAKRRLGAETYDLVITDLMMEHETAGFEVVRFARKQSYRPAVAILTACCDLGRDWKQQGASSLLIKPTNAPELLECIEALLSRQQNTPRRPRRKTVGDGAAGDPRATISKR